MSSNSTSVFCDICLARNITKPGEVYCPQCNETLCADCRDRHIISNLSKSHQTITIEQFNKLPPFVRQIKQYCEEHGDIFEFLCPAHDTLCCKRCITTNHSKCRSICVLEDILKTSDSSTALESLEKTLQDIEKNIEIVIKDRQQNLKDLEIHKGAVSKQIKSKREQMNNYLDKLERDILQKLEQIEIENKKQIENLLSKIEKLQDEAQECKRNIDLMKKHASSIQIFMGVREIQELVSSTEKYIQDKQNNGSLDYTSIELTVNEQFDRFTKEVVTFGDLKVKEDPTKIALSWHGLKSAQIFKFRRKPYTIDDIHLQMELKVDIQGYQIAGCLTVPNKNILFTANKNSIVLQYDIDGKFVSSIKIDDGRAHGIFPVDKQTVMVTNGDVRKNLVEIDTVTWKTKRTISTNNYSYDATFVGDAVIACTYYDGIKRFQISEGKVTSETVLVKMDASYTYITSDNNFLYHSNYKTDSITCFDLEGNSVWTFKDKILQRPYGITLDFQSNIYVVGYRSNNVVVISPDGQRCRQLLGPSDGLNNPSAIYYDKDSDYLLISNNSGSAFMYKIA